MSDVRYARQVILPEIGAAGQVRIGLAEVPVQCSGPARHVEELYLSRAGAKPVSDKPTRGHPEAQDRLFDELGLSHPGPAWVALGALAALFGLRAVLDGDAEAP